MTKMKKNWATFIEMTKAPLRNQSGFTLIELIVSIAITSIILLSATFVFTTASQAKLKADALNEQQLLIDGVIEVISSELRYATDIGSVNHLADGHIAGYKIVRCQGQGGNTETGGQVYIDNVLVFNTNDLIGQNLDITFFKDGDFTLKMVVKANDDYGNELTDTEHIHCLNMKALDTPIDFSDTDGMTHVHFIKYKDPT